MHYREMGGIELARINSCWDLLGSQVGLVAMGFLPEIVHEIVGYYDLLYHAL